MSIEFAIDNSTDIVVFSDLDGTLLDGVDYSFSKALPALELLREKNIPIIFCTSKTLPEVEIYRHRLNNHDPFVVENGGAIYIPDAYFDVPFEYDRVTAGYRVRELGTPYEVLVDALAEVRRRTGAPLRGFADMTVREVAERCNLTLDQAALAKQREYDEPFLILDVEAASRVVDAIAAPVTRGDRFHHLSGSDKGRAVTFLIELFRRSRPDAVSVGIGNRSNDLALLEAVDVPILVAREEGEYDPGVAVPGLRYAGGVGPEGWNSAILNLSAHLAAPLGRADA